ncbi:MAG: tetratricopeptide repeat protein [Lachnospiraceae bacterium]|nr:tetratricopeptide repeat protein [Lachnospiraceae bacterium]
MKRIGNMVVLTILLLALTACGKSMADRWQEQYDLGQKYLLEEDYEAAIVAFTAAIEIDPNEAAAYVGRGDAYILSGETEENLTLALVDYEAVLSLYNEALVSGEDGISEEMSEALVQAYLGMADVYIAMGDYEAAEAILQQGLEATGDDQRILEKIASFTESDVDATNNGQYASENGEDTLQFMSRGGYVDFDELEGWKQSLVEALFEVVQDLDDEAIQKTAEIFIAEMDYDTSTYWSTIWKNYKVECNIRREEDDGDPNNIYHFEIRPQNGIGYYIHAEHVLLIDISKVTDDSWWDYYYNTQITYGQCVDWQWNGEATSLETCESLWHTVDGTTDESITSITETGMVQDNYRDGNWTRSYYRWSNWNGSVTENNWTSSKTFSNGILVEEDGEVVEENDYAYYTYNGASSENKLESIIW